jgi:hypothetical protein
MTVTERSMLSRTAFSDDISLRSYNLSEVIDALAADLKNVYKLYCGPSRVMQKLPEELVDTALQHK